MAQKSFASPSWIRRAMEHCGLVPSERTLLRPFRHAIAAVCTWIAASVAIPVGVLLLLRVPDPGDEPLVSLSEVVLMVFVAGTALTFDVYRVRELLIGRRGWILSVVQLLHPILTAAVGLIYAIMSRTVGGSVEFFSDTGNMMGSVSVKAGTVDAFGNKISRITRAGSPGETLSGSAPFGLHGFPTLYMMIVILAAVLFIYYKLVLELAAEQQEVRFEREAHDRLELATRNLTDTQRASLHAEAFRAFAQGRVDEKAGREVRAVLRQIGCGYLVPPDSGL
jgi:hypothetical protein